MSLEIVTIPCLRDNYAYLLRDASTGKVALIDAPEPGPIEAELKERGWSLDLILITHHHSDHVDGVEPLRAARGARVVGAAADARRLPRLDEAVGPGDRVAVGDSVAIVMDAPGHTVGHVAYHFPEAKAAFTADSLMVMGCGRLFEGTAEQMWETLCRFAALPGDTMIYSGHEYAEGNAHFALSVDGDNAALRERATAIAAMRQMGGATVPARLDTELATNPFLRARDPEVKRRLGMESSSDAGVFAEIRRRKDSF